MNNKTVIIEIGCNEPPIVPKSVNHRCTTPKIKESTKELEVMDIDWSKAPEGATHYGIESGDYYSGFYKIISSDEGFFHDKSQWLKCGSWPELTEKPQQPLTYTQEMCDNGELPSVGMECLIKMIGAYLPVTITYNSEHVIAFTYKTDNGVVETCKQKELHNIDIKPLTPPIELIDGGRYEIEFCFGDYRMVYYKKSNHSFYDSILCDSKVCHASSVKNIQPLTVEVK